MKRLIDGHGLMVLLDPGRTQPEEAARVGREAQGAGAAGIMIGSSFDGTRDTHLVAEAVRAAAPGLPIALFPGSAMQLTPAVDVVLFLSLVSGRNPQYLIEEHVRSVPFFQRHPVPTLSTAYVLVDGGCVTSVEAVSQTRPLPADKPELAAAHLLAARMIGMQALYLDAGSGAQKPVPGDVIRACRRALDGARFPIFVGGGIRTPEQARAARQAGADFVVIGTVLERNGEGENGSGGGGASLERFARAVAD
ncbi:MAG TPA: geranylgeranylglyceryl/heptaprenylglyceryl phosphate synthase [Gemmatimonadales bacterium]|nr:geranylgeranylglyceryl/heptaprenylglyceryl phosphate synthase [Gemmatimonadales bacterium]